MFVTKEVVRSSWLQGPQGGPMFARHWTTAPELQPALVAYVLLPTFRDLLRQGGAIAAQTAEGHLEKGSKAHLLLESSPGRRTDPPN